MPRSKQRTEPESQELGMSELRALDGLLNLWSGVQGLLCVAQSEGPRIALLELMLEAERLQVSHGPALQQLTERAYAQVRADMDAARVEAALTHGTPPEDDPADTF